MTERIEGGAYTRAVRLDGTPLVLRVAALAPGISPEPAERAGRKEQPGSGPMHAGAERDKRGASPGIGAENANLHVAVLGAAPEARHLRAGAALAERVFATGADLSSLEADVADDPVFAALARRYRGLRPVLIADPFEAIVWAILGQQINVRFAAKLKHALIERFGTRLHLDGHEFLLFPEPETLAALDHDRDLRPLQFSRQKSEYTILVARAIAGGHLDLDALRTVPADEALARLTALKGIGRWTAEYVLMRAFGYPDVIPAADGGLRRIIGRAYGLGRLATEMEVRDIAARWAGWRAYAAFYWWFTLQLEHDARTLP